VVSDFGMGPSLQQHDAMLRELVSLQNENDVLRRRVRRYHRGSIALGTLLVLGFVVRVWAVLAGVA
jgi:hypothetical protein